MNILGSESGGGVPAASTDADVPSGPRAAALQVAQHLEAHVFQWTNERELQHGIGDALAPRFDVQAEVVLSRHDRPDFVVTVPPYRVAIEVKVAGARTAILRQLSRYAAHASVDALVLAAGLRALLPGIPTEIHGKPVLVAHTRAPLR